MPMDTGRELLELQEQEAQELNPQAEGPNNQKSKSDNKPRIPLLERPRVRLAVQIASGIIALFLIVFLVFYIKLTRRIDSHLAVGPFASTTAIYATPRIVAPGDAMTPEDLARRLRRSGYSASSENPTGWFKESSDAIEIF